MLTIHRHTLVQGDLVRGGYKPVVKYSDTSTQKQAQCDKTSSLAGFPPLRHCALHRNDK